MPSLFSELKRRNVVRVGLAYLVVSWLLIQLAGVLEPALLLPGWVDRVVTVFLLIGFPIVLIFAWAFEITPDGITLTSKVDPTESITGSTGKKLEYATIGLLALLVVFFLVREFMPSTDEGAEIPESAASKPTSIAVLPFEDFSEGNDQEFFSKGISEEILNLLAKTNGLRVAARTSSFAFGNRDVDIREIGDKLNVDAILEGSIRKAGLNIRITAQLIDIESGYHLWSDTYDRDYKDIFKIQDEIAAKILVALKVHLLGDVAMSANTAPTVDMDAYNAYLIGNGRLALRTREDIEAAKVLFEEALSIDSEYAPAHVGVAHADLLLEQYRFGGDQTVKEDVDAAIKEHLEKALALAPDLPEAVGIRGYYQLRRHRYKEAEETFNRAIALNRNYALAYTWRATTAYEQERFLDMLADKEKAYSLDPMSLEISRDLAFQYRSFWRPKDAERVINRMFDLHPGHPVAYEAALDNLHAHGRVGEALLVADKGLQAHPEDENLLEWRAWLLLQAGLMEEAEAMARDDVTFWAQLMQGRYEEAKTLLEQHLAEDDPQSYWYTFGRDYYRYDGQGPADPEFSVLLDKSLASLEMRGVQWRERCMFDLIYDLRDVGRDDEVADMMGQCNKRFEERLKVKYLCPCSFFGLVINAVLDGRNDEAISYADQWLTNGDSMSFLPFIFLFNELDDRPEYEDLLVRNEEQLERQRQIYFAGREKTAEN